jgi:hypothetical protein
MLGETPTPNPKLCSAHLKAREAAERLRLEVGASPHCQLPQCLQRRGSCRQPTAQRVQLQLHSAAAIVRGRSANIWDAAPSVGGVSTWVTMLAVCYLFVSRMHRVTGVTSRWRSRVSWPMAVGTVCRQGVRA